MIRDDDGVKETLRRKVLDALDEAALEIFNQPHGWRDEDLPNLFHTLDQHLDRLYDRFRPKTYIVSAGHRDGRYRLRDMIFTTSNAPIEGQGRINNNHVDALYWASLKPFGHGRCHITPTLAIYDLLLSNGCTNIKIRTT